MKKKRTVTNPKPKDLTSRQLDKYCLKHQEQDAEGGVHTQLYKVTRLIPAVHDIVHIGQDHILYRQEYIIRRVSSVASIPAYKICVESNVTFK